MTLAEGLEAKELRQALYTIEQYSGLGPTHKQGLCPHGCDTPTIAFLALKRPKSSYEQEAELMEAWYLSVKKSEEDLKELHDPLVEMGMDNHSMMDLEREARRPSYKSFRALEKFRGERTQS